MVIMIMKEKEKKGKNKEKVTYCPIDNFDKFPNNNLEKCYDFHKNSTQIIENREIYLWYLNIQH